MIQFRRKKTPTIMDGLVVRWTVSKGHSRAGEISASRNGVLVSGYFPRTCDKEWLKGFKATLDIAFDEYRKMARRGR
jgi:hypothetical protein